MCVCHWVPVGDVHVPQLLSGEQDSRKQLVSLANASKTEAAGTYTAIGQSPGRQQAAGLLPDEGAGLGFLVG
jgi:hypothetical protein